MRTLGTGGRLADRVSRRALLGAAVAGGVLVACGGAPPPTQAPAAKPGPEGSSAPTAAVQAAAATAPVPVGPGSPAPAATSAAAAPLAATPAPAPAGVKVVTPVAEPPTKRVGTVSSFYWTENPPTLDPYLNVSFRSQTFAGAFYSRLLRSKKGPGLGSHAYVMEGDLAESWKVAEDGQTFTFTLRPNAKWHNKPPMNGRAVTSKDVAWSFERFVKVSPQKATFDVV
ncbi:MAG TPA: ABC transporter substrate-binding protein, partial [Chloroflexota bacterium]